jgi:hypothetical protein
LGADHRVTAEDCDLSGLLDLASERQCHDVAFDRPGFGYSDRPRGAMWTPAQQADLFRQAFARLGIERPVVATSRRTASVRATPSCGTPPPGRRVFGPTKRPSCSAKRKARLPSRLELMARGGRKSISQQTLSWRRQSGANPHLSPDGGQVGSTAP